MAYLYHVLYDRHVHCFCQFDLGSGPLLLFTSKTFNDGKWHSIEVTRVDKKGNLKVDGLTDKDGYINSTEASGDNTIFKVLIFSYVIKIF